MNICKRILFLLPGLVKELFKIANNGARNIELRSRFPKSIIDEGCCISRRVKLGIKTKLQSGCIINGSQIGDYTYICRNALIQNTVIGNYCSISHDFISGLGNHPLDCFLLLLYFIERQIRLR